MGLHEKIKIKKLRETVVLNYDEGSEIVIVQYKQSYKGLSVYKVFSELIYDGELFDIIESYATFSKEKSEKYFSKLESKYPESRLTRKIF